MNFSHGVHCSWFLFNWNSAWRTCWWQVCIFAYGQTGSGKTHTMLGSQDLKEQRGVIPRSLEQIFKTSQAMSLQGWSFRMQVIFWVSISEQHGVWGSVIIWISFPAEADLESSLTQASMLEIYNETIRDLLARPSKDDSARNENGTPAKQYIVKHDPNGNTNVSDLTLVDVSNWKEVASLLQRASQSR